VRRAINLAVDKRAIVEKILLGFGSVPEGPVPTGAQYSTKLEPYPYDPARARVLLAEAGYPHGFSTVIWTPHGRYLKDREIAEAIQGYLAEIGIRAELKVWEWAPYVEAIRRPDKEAGMYMLGISIPTADWRLFRNFHSTAPTNYTGYRNPEVDRLLLEARSTFDVRKQRTIYERVQRLIWEDAPFLFAYNQAQIIGVRKGLSGLTVFGFETMRLNNIVVRQ
jgi:ABC-type transport system substrate-binding protein